MIYLSYPQKQRCPDCDFLGLAITFNPLGIGPDLCPVILYLVDSGKGSISEFLSHDPIGNLFCVFTAESSEEYNADYQIGKYQDSYKHNHTACVKEGDSNIKDSENTSRKNAHHLI